jgi:hypothetical protein
MTTGHRCSDPKADTTKNDDRVVQPRFDDDVGGADDDEKRHDATRSSGNDGARKGNSRDFRR